MELGLMTMPPDEDLELCHELGIKHGGMSFNVADPAETQKAIDHARSNGIEPMAIIGALPMPLDHALCLHEFAKILRFFAKTWDFKEIEVLPEPSCPYVSKGQYNVRRYQEVMKCGYETIKEVNPNILVYNGGIGQHGTLWTVQAFIEESLDYTDALNIHLFQFDGNPHRVVELIVGMMTHAHLWMKWRGKVKPMICTEWAYPTAKQETTYGSFLEDYKYIDPKNIPPRVYFEQGWIMKEVLESAAPMLDRMHLGSLHDNHSSNYWGGECGVKDKVATEFLIHWAKRRRVNNG